MSASTHPLVSADLRRALEFSADLASCRTEEELGRQALLLAGLIGSDAILIAEVRLTPSAGNQSASLSAAEDPPGFLDGGAGAAFMRLWDQHPVVALNVQRSSSRALKVSDFLTDRQWRRRELFNDCYRPIGFPWEIGVQIRVSPEVHSCAALLRNGLDFDERDRAMLETIGPHLRAAYTRSAAEARRDRRLTLLERGVEHRGDTVLLVDRRGQIAAGGAKARATLEEWFGDTGGGSRLPAAVENWRLSPRGLPDLAPLDLRRADRRLRLRLIAGVEEDAILISEHRDERLEAGRLMELLPITRREAEVLALLAEGRINASIALELGLSPNTVGRYVERIYSKLDVHNRVAATVAVRDALEE